MLMFALDGCQDASADELATFMNQPQEACFLPAARRRIRRTIRGSSSAHARAG
jgi:hypothetical protein